jgi:hypothetical protein
MTEANTDNCTLYVTVFNSLGNEAVLLYKDAAKTILVASGLGGPGVIPLNDAGLGLQGTVTWNGTSVDASMTLSC